MTEKELMAKVDLMLIDLRKALEAEVRRLLANKEVIAMGSYPNDYTLPKIILTAALYNLRILRMPETPASKAAVEALTKV